jgi:hypothetical protein
MLEAGTACFGLLTNEAISTFALSGAPAQTPAEHGAKRTANHASARPLERVVGHRHYSLADADAPWFHNPEPLVSRLDRKKGKGAP